MSVYGINSYYSGVTPADIKNVIYNMGEKSPTFRKIVDYMADNNITVAVELVDNTSWQGAGTWHGGDNTGYSSSDYSTYDYQVLISAYAFDGDTYNDDAGTWTLERYIAHEFMHVMLDSNGLGISGAEGEEWAVVFEDAIMNEIDPSQADHESYYNTPGDPQSGINAESKDPAGVDPEDNVLNSSGPTPPLPDGGPAWFGPYEKPEFVCDAENPWGSAPNQSSPLVLDLDGDGIELTAFNAASTGTLFDLDSDGFAEQTAWVSADDGLLVRDLDANGTIDNANELFGSPSIDGFALLAELDTNGDLVLDANDDDWGSLRIWKDADSDAFTDSGELLTLSSLNIVSIDLAGVTASTSTINGNPVSHTSTFKYDNGSTADIVDAWFVHDQVNSEYTGSYALGVEALLLPDLRGFGDLPALHVAMSLDGDLLTLVEDFVDEWGFERFADEASLDSDFEDILFTWAGVDGVNPTSRGNLFDARKLEFMEKFFGNAFVSYYGTPNPLWGALGDLDDAWDILFANLKSQVLVQLGAQALFDPGTVSYDAFTGAIEGALDLSETGLDSLIAYATDTGVSTEAYWIAVGHFLKGIKDFGDFTANENTWINDAIYDSDPLLSWSGIKDIISGSNPGTNYYGDSGNNTLTGGTGEDNLYGYAGEDTLSGGGGDDFIDGGDDNDLLYGNAGDDTIEGGAGDDTIYGGDGNDSLYGENGDDVLIPGDGGDYVNGGAGNDTYVYSNGDDIYRDVSNGGADEIQLGSGITSGDVAFYGIGNTNILIEIDDHGTILIQDQFFNSSNIRAIETLRFDDNSTINLLAIPHITVNGTPDDDILSWSYVPTGTDLTMQGFSGDDQLYGGAGDDVLDGGAGNDRLVGKAGNDTYIASPGFDYLTDESSSSNDVLVIPDSYGVEDITLYRFMSTPYNMLIQIAGLGQIEVASQFYGSGTLGLEYIEFENSNPTIDLHDVPIETRGTDGNDTLYGLSSTYTGQSDILFGGAGNDNLIGYAGNDTFVFSEGTDRIQESSGTDEILFRDDTDVNDLAFYRGYSTTNQYNDLYVEHVSGDIMHVYQYFSNSNYEVEQIRFADDSTFDLSTLSALDTIGRDGAADSISLWLSADDESIYGLGGNDTLTGGSGNDTLYGGEGNDTLSGRAGDDTYVFESGLDVVQESNLANSGNDTLLIAGGITINDITIDNYSTYHTKIVVDASVDEIEVRNLRHGDADYHVENLSFDDGFVTDLFTSYQSWMWGSTGSTLMVGNANDNVLIGKAGDDEMYGGAGDDDMHGGADNDEMYGEDGDDLLHGGTGDDILFGGDGLDILWGGEGADTFVFENGSAFNDADIVKDFSTTDDDVIDLIDIMDNTAFDPMTDAITDWIEFTTVGSDTVVKVDRDGTGGTYGFDQIATLEGVTGLTDEAALVTSGHLLLAA